MLLPLVGNENEYQLCRFPYGLHAHQLKQVSFFVNNYNLLTRELMARHRNFIAILSGLLHIPQLETLIFNVGGNFYERQNKHRK